MDLQGGGVGTGNAKFASLEQLVATLEGKRVLKRVLIANNGVAALKGIMSMRHWAYEMVGDENAVQFVCMATPEDIRVNVEYIKMADETVEVPGGRNSNNYANVPLIIDTAKRTGCDAVWAGWGHASENPALPDGLKKEGIMFLGPPGKAMYELGDKIASTIVAQSAGVPTIAWSGSGLSCPPGTSGVPQETFDAACVRDADHCLEVCRQLQFPLMIKASEGGGGKGIRMVHREEDVVNAYHAVAGEVLRSPIFVMRLAAGVRHLEVQLLADEHGECMALRSRDCSVQRRHQKIIEEGPCSRTVAGALPKMEEAAVRLAKLVGYRGVGTVEYLYDKEKGSFYFLELNPRLQVEHTVTELISGVNLPACMLLVGMGIPLHRIPDIRAFCGEKRLGTSRIDFMSPFEHPQRHTIACRITAENPEDGFTPTTGRIDEITFRNSKQTWGYFSVSSHGGVHEFADSQFGHIFSTAATREDAIAAMVLALKQLTIRGEIRTNKEYLVKLLDMPAFKECDISTAWLDGLIKQKLRTEAPNNFLSVLCAATYKAVERFESNRAKYLSFLEAGHVPNSELITTSMKFALVLDQVKYEVHCMKSSPTAWVFTLCGTHIEVNYRRLADRGLLVTLEGGRSPVVYAEEDAACMRVTIDGRTSTFTNESDPTKLRSQMPGKLVRYMVRDGDFVEANQPFCEIEVMKMYLQLKTSVAGTITLKGQPGTAVQTGKLLAAVEPKDPSSVVRAEENAQGWPTVATMCGGAQTEAPIASSRLGEVHQQVRTARLACERACNLLLGYSLPKDLCEQVMSKLAESISLVAGRNVQLQTLSMPWLIEGLEEDQASALDCVDRGADRMTHVISKLLNRFLEVETLYEGGRLQQEVIESLRAERQESGRLEEVFETEIAHAGPYRHRVIAQLLKASEPIAQRVRTLVQRLSVLTEPKAAMVVFTARHMLRMLDLPPAGSRDKALRDALTAALGSPRRLAALTDEVQYGPEVISSCLMNESDPLLQSALELFLRRLYTGVIDMRELTFDRTDDARKQLFASWRMNAKATHDNPLKHDIAGGQDPWAEERDATASMKSDRSEATGMLGVFENVAEVESRFHLLVMRSMSAKGSTVLEVFVRETKEHTHGVLASEFARVLKDNLRSLQTTQVSRVTFTLVSSGRTPRYYTFRKQDDFVEDATYRHIAPSLAYMLELPKLRNYDIQLYRSNPIPQVHVYIAKERPGTRRGPAQPPRLFVRTAVLPSDVSTGDPEKFKKLGLFDAERVIADCVHALEIATADRSLPQSRGNHVFVAFEGLVARYSDMDYVIQKLAELHGSSFYAVGVIEIEIKIRCTGLAGEKEKEAVPMRWYVRNPTTKALEVETYIEVEDSQQPGRSILVHLHPDGSAANHEESVGDGRVSPVLKRLDSVLVGNLGLRGGVATPSGSRLRHGTSWEDLSTFSAESGGSGKGQVRTGIESTRSWEHGSKRQFYWHRNPPLAPYPLVSSHQARRMQALSQNTVYCYDWVVLFDKAIREMWQEAVQGRTDLPGLAAAMPKDPLVAREVVYSPKEGKLVEMFRAAGENTCAMVGWLWTVRCPHHYNSETGVVNERQVYVVCNDITLQSGSFSTSEDEMFAAVSRAAVSQGVPLLYISANSGARIGLDNEVKKHFKVKQTTDPGKLFEYLYLDDETMKKLEGKAPVVETEPVIDPASGQTHHKLTSVIGAQWGLGVENLSGSGLIAGEMARAWEKIPTISLVSGRSVGIGAYLVRLGRRVVQTRNSPIILTGHNALNKVLGKDVYSSNNQLGGQNIMGPNGVSHWLVSDDYKAVQSVLKYLSYVPDRVGTAAMGRIGFKQDPVDRDVLQQVTRGTPYDPRLLLNGSLSEEGVWTAGLFDRDSFQESLSDWAKSVVVGRAKLGGIPTGVIVAETRALSKFNPADPADPASSSALTQQAGMVWYPDSSRKTADHLADLQREGLPCIVIANWRGFSGGMRDMYDEVLKFGADIVQNLTSFELPVLVYIPPAGELRGGAWVVIDPKINPRHIEMFVDNTARGGVLEPEGIVEIKFRDKEILATIDRLDPECSRLAAQLATAEGQLADYLRRTLHARHEQLYPAYKAVAVEFADLHDKPGRMMAVGSIGGVVPWKNSRRFLHWRLRRRLGEAALRKRLEAEAGVKEWSEQSAIMARWAVRENQGLVLENEEDEEESVGSPAPELTDEDICTALDSLLYGSSEKRLADGLRSLSARHALDQLETILARHPELKARLC
eukprot:Hpha_TRINITY_DN16118_c1_g13::TRINITY_DN16118_c1_g13_i1::g.8204::m.8204/K11262/ACACA; acetyl-CoA carboxylase / biotin carboxylase 1